MAGVDADESWRRESLQMWEFVSGIEGFGVCRAADCLSKLFHAHYDTMRVLKLVTKRDLIEDAGFKPGDALRVVAAAKEYKPPADNRKRPHRRAVSESTAVTEVPGPAKKESMYPRTGKGHLTSWRDRDLRYPRSIPVEHSLLPLDDKASISNLQP